MKKYLILFVTIILTACLMIGCSPDNTTDQTNSTNDAQPTGGIQTTSDAVADPIDKSLTGADLLNSISITMPNSYMVKYEVEVAGMSSDVITYVKGESMRMEATVSIANTTATTIYNASEGATYQYTDGSSVGTVIYDEEDSESTDAENIDNEQNLANFSDITAALGEDTIARIEELDGQEVVYIETSGLTEDDSSLAKMWFSTETGIPLKTEISLNGEVMMTQKVTDYDPNKQIDDSMFTPPDNITFSEYSLDY